jgi:thiamine biosynthesis lipoprotein ApbE
MNGQNAVRETKNQLITKTYQRLKIKDVVNVYTNHKRGVYVSKLYENAEQFLQYKIEEKDLIPQKFDISVNELVNFWKFGFQGDSKKSKNQKLLDIANNKIKHSNKNSPAKVRLQYLIDKAKENNQSHIIEHLPTDWYGQMQQLTMDESKKLYLSGVGR